MENQPNDSKKNVKNPLSKWVILLGILTAVFFCTTLYFAIFAKPVYNIEYNKTADEKEALSNELDELMAQHEEIKAQYSELSDQLTEKDSIINANAEEIKKLIASQADYRKIKKQLARLQDIAKEYVEEMDKLYTENQQLKEENTQVKENLAKSREANEAMQKDNEALNQRIQTASAIKIYNVSGKGVYHKSRSKEEVVTEKASKVEQLKISCLLAENSLRENGSINLYCRIALPGTGRVLCQGKGDTYTFENNGEKLQYTTKTTVNYTGKSENVVMVWDLKKDDKAIKGTYKVQIFSDEGYLGETSFTLK